LFSVCALAHVRAETQPGELYCVMCETVAVYAFGDTGSAPPSSSSSKSKAAVAAAPAAKAKPAAAAAAAAPKSAAKPAAAKAKAAVTDDLVALDELLDSAPPKPSANAAKPGGAKGGRPSGKAAAAAAENENGDIDLDAAFAGIDLNFDF
jgi:hypothetical protein